MRFTGAVQIRAAYMETGLTIPQHGAVVEVKHAIAKVWLTFADGKVKGWKPAERVLVTEAPCPKCGGLGRVAEARMTTRQTARNKGETGTALAEPEETHGCDGCGGVGY